MSGGTGAGGGGGREPSFRRGCLMGMIVLTLLASGIGYMIWRAFNRFNPPEELRPYAFGNTFDSLVISDAPAREDSHPLDSAELHFYLGAIDTVWNAWSEFERVYDSAYAERDPEEPFDPMDLDEVGIIFWRIPLYARRGLVDHLNASDRSWAEYLSIKERVIAATDITHREVGDSIRSFLHQRNFNLDEGELELPNQKLFTRAEKLRASAIDSTERTLVAPYRDLLVTRGLHTLSGMEEAFYGEE